MRALALDRTMRDGTAGDGRAFLRLPVSLQTSICSSSVRRLSAVLTDISVTGCRLATPIQLQAGCHLTITIPTLAAYGATVRWCRGNGIGLEFAQPLHPLVVAHVATLSRGAEG